MKRIITVTASVLAFALLLSGCFVKPVDELYCLPKQTNNYYNLQEVVQQVIDSGLSYCGPTSGSNQQAVQLTDLDGDGEDEAVLFAIADDSAPLKLYIFDKQNDVFQNIAVIEGEGSSFESVQYLQIDGKAGLEIVIGRQLSDKISRSLSVYSLADGTLSELLTTNYTEYAAIDMDSDRQTDILILRADSEERNGVAELYRYSKGFLQRDNEAMLSVSVDNVRRIITGNMCKNVPAVFVASTYDETNIVTDVFTLREGKLVNLNVADPETNSTATVRNYYVYSTDIDYDGLIELPSTQRLSALREDEASQNQWVINWFNMKLDGSRVNKAITYHCYENGWYLLLSRDWVKNLCVSRTQPEGALDCYGFYLRSTGETALLLEIYCVSTSARSDFEANNSALFLTEKGSTVFYAVLGEGADAAGITEGAIRDMFRLIQQEWNTGEV